MSYGPKAETLQKLAQLGFNVPKFLAISQDQINDLRSDAGRQAFLDRLQSWQKSHGIVEFAVRSSGDKEDSKHGSMAGAFQTVLNVKPNQVIKAIKEVDQSAKGTSAKMNIVIQEMLHPSVAGVTFTLDPTGQTNGVIINSLPGLGKAVVDGEDSDQYLVERKGLTVTSQRLTQAESTLSKDQIREITRTCLDIEAALDSPQDIEWALVKDRLHILQSRPITGYRQRMIFDSSNISESYPGITLPLTISVAKKAYAYVYRSQARLSGLSASEIEGNHRIFESMLGVFRGQLFYNLASWYQYMSLFPGTSHNQRFFDEMVETEGEAFYKQTKARSLTFKLRYYSLVCWRAIRFKHELLHFYNTVERELGYIDSMPMNTLEDCVAKYNYIEEKLLPIWGITVDNDFLAMVYNGMLNRLHREWLQGLQANLKNDSLSSISNVASAQQAHDLKAIAAELKEHDSIRQLILEQKYDQAWRLINDSSHLLNKITTYRAIYGNRFALDLKLEAKNPVASSKGFLQLIRPYLMLDKADQPSPDRYSKSVESINNRLGLFQRPVYRWVAGRLRFHIREREHSRLLRSRLFQLCRETFAAMATSLVRHDLLDQASDIYYLEADELVGYVNGSLSIDLLRPLALARRMEYEGYDNTELPVRFNGVGLPKQFQPVATKDKSAGKMLMGQVSSSGKVTGIATVMTEPIIPSKPLEILVVKQTDPGWTPIIGLSRGVIVERGGILSHAAIITRELGIPCVIGVGTATSTIKTGDTVMLDAYEGKVAIEGAEIAAN